MLVLVFKSDYTTRRANGIFQQPSVAICKNQNSSYRGKFDPNFDREKRNLVRVCGEFELSEFELTE